MTHSLAAHEAVNAVPGIGEKVYLELGVGVGVATYRQVVAGTKIGVDVAVGGSEGIHMMTTAEYFAGPGDRQQIDVAYIDASHVYEDALHDFNQVVARLNKGGLVLLHDMYPPNEEHATPAWCGDVYKLLAVLWSDGQQCMVLEDNYGLTAVFGARRVIAPPDAKDLTYQRFLELQIPTVTADQMLEAIKAL